MQTLAPKRTLWRDHVATESQLRLFEQAQPPKKPPQRHGGKVTQRDLVLGLLREARSRGVALTLPAIMKLGIAQHGARLNELRRLGYGIENKMERIDGVVHSSYRLTFDPEQDAVAVQL